VKSSRVGAVVVGVIAAGIVGNVLNLGILSVVFLAGRLSGGPDALVAFRGSPLQWWLWVLTGVVALAVGGFASTRVAGDDGLKAALIFGLAYLALQLAYAAFRPPDSWWPFLADLALIVPAAILGGRLARRRAEPALPADGGKL
jgi:hypothetical protein